MTLPNLPRSVNPEASRGAPLSLFWGFAGLVYAIVAAISHLYYQIPLAFALALLLVILTFRIRPPACPTARWSSPAELLQDGRKYPGELEVTDQSLVWIPTHSAHYQGSRTLELVPNPTDLISTTPGPGLFDTVVELKTTPNSSVRFQTHRIPGLRKALDRITPPS
jgi:hypothetical protein